MLVASSGGHLFQLIQLEPLWARRDHVWVSFATADARSLLANKRVHWAFHPTNRSLLNLWRNLRLAFRLLRAERPDVVLSTGAGVSVPFLLLARLMGMRTIYLESITRIHELSLSGRLVYPFVSRFLVQWEELTAQYPRAEFHGRVL
ncbi:MAG: UDP-N-acetylglucosamine--LPS N-acetylglucosamine transferase [Rickettsiales bacterium]|nr:UDP-N-acetylglucosamine--LPS N-acetylglucosamine transferase [Rickettsiales bacterium]|tara:strand:+ start:568 stop:1008 length:441 start_codon:yes stop_codon:yes gene_type:complete